MIYTDPIFIFALAVVIFALALYYRYTRNKPEKKAARHDAKLAKAEQATINRAAAVTKKAAKSKQAKTAEEIDALAQAEEILRIAKLRQHYTPDDGVIAVRLYDNMSGDVYNTKITEADYLQISKAYGGLGRRVEYEGRWIYLVNRHFPELLDEEGNVTGASDEPAFRPALSVAVMSGEPSPGELFQDVNQPEVTMFVRELAKEDDKSLMDKFWGALPWLALLFFIGFLYVNGGQ